MDSLTSPYILADLAAAGIVTAARPFVTVFLKMLPDVSAPVGKKRVRFGFLLDQSPACYQSGVAAGLVRGRSRARLI